MQPILCSEHQNDTENAFSARGEKQLPPRCQLPGKLLVRRILPGSPDHLGGRADTPHFSNSGCIFKRIFTPGPAKTKHSIILVKELPCEIKGSNRRPITRVHLSIDSLCVLSQNLSDGFISQLICCWLLLAAPNEQPEHEDQFSVAKDGGYTQIKIGEKDQTQIIDQIADAG